MESYLLWECKKGSCKLFVRVLQRLQWRTNFFCLFYYICPVEKKYEEFINFIFYKKFWTKKKMKNCERLIFRKNQVDNFWILFLNYKFIVFHPKTFCSPFDKCYNKKFLCVCKIWLIALPKELKTQYKRNEIQFSKRFNKTIHLKSYDFYHFHLLS